jgi:hypothetical protein
MVQLIYKAQDLILRYLNRLEPGCMKKYLSEKNALTVMVSLFCLIMMFVSLIKQQSMWETIAFTLAFSFSIELICHRTKENS